MGSMYAWATKEYCLDELSLPQLMKYHKKGWEAKQTENRVNWSILGTLLNGENPEQSETKHKGPPIEDVRRYSGYENAYYDKNGKLVRG